MSTNPPDDNNKDRLSTESPLSKECGLSESRQRELFAALTAAKRAESKHKRDNLDLLKGHKLTQEERNEYFRKAASLKTASHSAFLAAFPRLLQGDARPYTERSIEEQRRLLEDEYSATMHEIWISQLVYRYHGCDSYEDLFRDNVPRIEEKCDGIRIALEQLEMGDYYSESDTDSDDDTSSDGASDSEND